jgi:hypothetical protein
METTQSLKDFLRSLRKRRRNRSHTQRTVKCIGQSLRKFLFCDRLSKISLGYYTGISSTFFEDMSGIELSNGSTAYGGLNLPLVGYLDQKNRFGISYHQRSKRSHAFYRLRPRQTFRRGGGWDDYYNNGDIRRVTSYSTFSGISVNHLAGYNENGDVKFTNNRT